MKVRVTIFFLVAGCSVIVSTEEDRWVWLDGQRSGRLLTPQQGVRGSSLLDLDSMPRRANLEPDRRLPSTTHSVVLPLVTPPSLAVTRPAFIQPLNVPSDVPVPTVKLPPGFELSPGSSFTGSSFVPHSATGTDSFQNTQPISNVDDNIHALGNSFGGFSVFAAAPSAVDDVSAISTFSQDAHPFHTVTVRAPELSAPSSPSEPSGVPASQHDGPSIHQLIGKQLTTDQMMDNIVTFSEPIEQNSMESFQNNINTNPTLVEAPPMQMQNHIMSSTTFMHPAQPQQQIQALPQFPEPPRTSFAVIHALPNEPNNPIVDHHQSEVSFHTNQFSQSFPRSNLPAEPSGFNQPNPLPAFPPFNQPTMRPLLSPPAEQQRHFPLRVLSSTLPLDISQLPLENSNQKSDPLTELLSLPPHTTFRGHARHLNDLGSNAFRGQALFNDIMEHVNNFR